MNMEEEEIKKDLGTTDATSNAVQVIKAAILQSQQRALKAINQEQLALYYVIGRYVSANTRKKNWGKGTLAIISEQLRKELPGLKGFSERNLKNMRTFYEEWRMLENYNSAGRTAEFTEVNTNSAGGTAELQAEGEIRQLQLTNLPEFPVVAFLSISFTHHTAILSQAKSYEERKFYIQLAADYKVKTEELEQLMKDDLYNHQGQLAGYLRILDDEVRKPNENPSIGIVLCKSANKKFVEYVIQDYDRPMGVATYKTSADMDDRLKKLLPSVEELKKLL